MNDMNERLDKSAFIRHTVNDAIKPDPGWVKVSLAAKLQAAYHLSLRVYGYHPDYPPKMDRQLFCKRSRS